MDRFHLVSDVIDRLPQLGSRAAYAKQAIRDKLIEHQQYICEHGDDMPEITGWRWGRQEVRVRPHPPKETISRQSIEAGHLWAVRRSDSPAPVAPQGDGGWTAAVKATSDLGATS